MDIFNQEKKDEIKRKLIDFWDNKVHFLQLHYLYILVLIFVFSGLYYCQPGTDWDYVDALFMATTGSTDTGLNTINMSEMTTYHMVLLYISSFLGCHVTVSFVVVLVRRYYFSKRFEEVLRYNKRRKEEYRKAKLLREQKAQEQKRLFDSLHPTQPKILNPIRRRISLLSMHSTPIQPNTHRFSLFHHKKHQGSMEAITKKDITVQHPNFEFPQNEKFFDPSKQTKLTEEPEEQELEIIEPQGSIHLEISIPDHTSQKSASIVESPLPIDDLVERGVQQITFSEDTNVLRERERKKFQLQQQTERPDLNRHNSEYEIMRQPTAKSQLTKDEKNRIGGTEYRALEVLARLIPAYYLGLILSFGFLFRIYIAASPYAQTVLSESNTTGPVGPWFFSFFVSLSAFTNLGLNHLDASMAPFKDSPVPLLMASFLILVGNTAFAIAMRFIIWFCYVLTPKRNVMRRESFRYLLDHPRRCYTTLFPATQTWWLLIVLVAITLVELFCFLALNYWLPVLEGMGWGTRILDGYFQSVATRNAGFSVISLADLNPGSQIVYIVAMYISVYPVAISMRNSNVYQERSLGIFRGEEEEEQVKFSDQELAEAPFIKLKRQSTMTSIAQNTKKLLKGPDFFVITQIQRQLTSDICWVITGIFLICVIEAKSIMSPSPVTVATVIYECVSAFGNVGASTGYPNTATSQTAQYRTLSKLVIICLMYKGRHRGLPASIDRSILLPSDELAVKEKEDEERRRNTTNILVTGDASNYVKDHLIYTRSCTL